MLRQQLSTLTHCPSFPRTKSFLQKQPRRHAVGQSRNFRTGFSSSAHVRGHADPQSAYSALRSWHNGCLHSNSGMQGLPDWLFSRTKPSLQKQPGVHCLVHDWDRAEQVSGHAEPQSLKNSLAPQEHCDRGTQTLLSSVLRTKPFLQKHPGTHWYVQNCGVCVQFSWQAVPHSWYSSLRGHCIAKRSISQKTLQKTCCLSYRTYWQRRISLSITVDNSCTNSYSWLRSVITNRLIIYSLCEC